MQRMTSIARPVGHMLIAVMLLLGIQLPARAALVDTGTLLQAPRDDAAHARLHQLLDRSDLRQMLADRGVDAAALQHRVNALTDDEARALAARIDAAPAGGADALVIGAVVFLVLLFTDIMGYTDIFPFVKKTVH
jgi:hypothetical protein